MFFLPKYCSEMNPIELEWQHLKKDELAAKTFEDEYYHCLCRHRWSPNERRKRKLQYATCKI
ncbi:hypothetical protein [Nostoc sp.]